MRNTVSALPPPQPAQPSHAQGPGHPTTSQSRDSVPHCSPAFLCHDHWYAWINFLPPSATWPTGAA
jgi:hypothetical protein